MRNARRDRNPEAIPLQTLPLAVEQRGDQESLSTRRHRPRGSRTGRRCAAAQRWETRRFDGRGQADVQHGQRPESVQRGDSASVQPSWSRNEQGGIHCVIARSGDDQGKPVVTGAAGEVQDRPRRTPLGVVFNAPTIPSFTAWPTIPRPTRYRRAVTNCFVQRTARLSQQDISYFQVRQGPTPARCRPGRRSRALAVAGERQCGDVLDVAAQRFASFQVVVSNSTT